MQELHGGGSIDGLNSFQGMNPMVLQVVMELLPLKGLQLLTHLLGIDVQLQS